MNLFHSTFQPHPYKVKSSTKKTHNFKMFKIQLCLNQNRSRLGKCLKIVQCDSQHCWWTPHHQVKWWDPLSLLVPRNSLSHPFKLRFGNNDPLKCRIVLVYLSVRKFETSAKKHLNGINLRRFFYKWSQTQYFIGLLKNL